MSKILVVDDEVILARAIARTLRGHEVAVVHSVAEAIALLATQEYDAIISDVMMPAATGADLHQWLVGHRPDLAGRVVYATGGMAPGPEAYVMATGLPVVAKPAGISRLPDLLREMT